MATHNVQYNPAGGPVTVEIFSGHATLGNYLLAIAKAHGGTFAEFGHEPKRLGDAVRDLHLVPVHPGELLTHVVLIIGKYMPAPDRTQINVMYVFVQDGRALDVDPPAHIEDALEEGGESFARFQDNFRFVPTSPVV